MGAHRVEMRQTNRRPFCVGSSLRSVSPFAFRRSAITPSLRSRVSLSSLSDCLGRGLLTAIVSEELVVSHTNETSVLKKRESEQRVMQDTRLSSRASQVQGVTESCSNDSGAREDGRGKRCNSSDLLIHGTGKRLCVCCRVVRFVIA